VEECAYIGLGSNLGDRELKLLMAIAELGKLPGTRVTAVSPFYETEPVGGVLQDNFFNAVVRLSTTLAPLTLLDELKRLETAVFKRVPSQRWGARSMDLDILLYGDLVFTCDRLTVPHPRIAELLAALTATEKVVRV